MPVNKPSQILGGGGTPVVRKARQSLGESRHAMNAALGLDDFSHLLKNSSPAGGGALMSQQSDAVRQGMPGGLAAGAPKGLPLSGGAQQQLLAQQAALQQLQQGMSTHLQQYQSAPRQVPDDHPAVADLRARGFSTDPEMVGNFQGMSKLQKVLMQSSNPLAVVNSLSNFRPAGDEAAQLSLRTRAHRGGVNAPNRAAAQGVSIKGAERGGSARAGGALDKAVDTVVGAVSAAFESGREGVAAVGYDGTGGTSYGKYQIASKTGTMDQFVNFLKEEAPELAARLGKAGPANTGGKHGKMPEEWRAIAAEQPERFAALQQAFIGRSHYAPAVERISERTGLNETELSPAMREAVFSTAVQHGAGGAGRIISRAVESVGVERLRSADPKEALRAEQEVIRKIYDNRAGQFGSSTSQVQASVQNRLRNELSMVLGMVNNNLA